MPPISDDSQEVFSDPIIAQAIQNVSDMVGMGIMDGVAPVKAVMEASYRVLDRRFGKPRETIELSHKIKLRIDVPGWSRELPLSSSEPPQRVLEGEYESAGS